MRNRWKCPHCGTEGWSTGETHGHDTPHGFSCRPSGQVSEAQAKRNIARRLSSDALHGVSIEELALTSFPWGMNRSPIGPRG